MESDSNISCEGDVNSSENHSEILTKEIPYRKPPRGYVTAYCTALAVTFGLLLSSDVNHLLHDGMKFLRNQTLFYETIPTLSIIVSIIAATSYILAIKPLASATSTSGLNITNQRVFHVSFKTDGLALFRCISLAIFLNVSPRSILFLIQTFSEQRDVSFDIMSAKIVGFCNCLGNFAIQLAIFYADTNFVYTTSDKWIISCVVANTSHAIGVLVSQTKFRGLLPGPAFVLFNNIPSLLSVIVVMYPVYKWIQSTFHIHASEALQLSYNKRKLTTIKLLLFVMISPILTLVTTRITMAIQYTVSTGSSTQMLVSKMYTIYNVVILLTYGLLAIYLPLLFRMGMIDSDMDDFDIDADADAAAAAATLTRHGLDQPRIVINNIEHSLVSTDTGDSEDSEDRMSTISDEAINSKDIPVLTSAKLAN